MIATNRSCLLARTLLRFAGFYKQPSFGVLRGLLCLEAYKLHIAFVIQSEITTFRKSSLFFVFGFALFFQSTENIFFLALLVSIDHSHSISQHKPSQKFNMCDFVVSSQAFVYVTQKIQQQLIILNITIFYFFAVGVVFILKQLLS